MAATRAATCLFPLLSYRLKSAPHHVTITARCAGKLKEVGSHVRVKIKTAWVRMLSPTYTMQHFSVANKMLHTTVYTGVNGACNMLHEIGNSSISCNMLQAPLTPV